MIKRILLAFALAASLGGAVVACNNSSTPVPTVSIPSTAPASAPAASTAPASDLLPSPSAS
jgi:hypothetical protein